MFGRVCGVALALSALVSSGAAEASVTLVGSPGGFTASYFNDFETAASSGPVTFTTGSTISASQANSGSPTTGFGFYVSPSGGIEALLSGYYTDVGMLFGNDDLCCTGTTAAILSVYDGSTFLGSVVVSANMNDVADQFIGLSSTQAFNRVVLNYADTSLARYIDNFQLGAATGGVPEPGTWAMMLLGFGAIGFAMRRQRNVTALA